MRGKFMKVCAEIDKAYDSIKHLDDYKDFAREAAKHKAYAAFLFPMKKGGRNAAEYFGSGETISGSIETVDKKLLALVFPK